MPKEDKEEQEEIEEIIEINENQEDGSELEEELDDSQFQQFMQSSSESIAPVLERIETPQPNLEQDIALTQPETKEPAPINYDVIREEQTRRYEIESAGMQPPVLRTNIQESGTEFLDPLRGMGIERQDEMRPRTIQTETGTQRRKLPFEREDEKYKEVKL